LAGAGPVPFRSALQIQNDFISNNTKIRTHSQEEWRKSANKDEIFFARRAAAPPFFEKRA
jgi:hypothetical protein